jgi:hypothetical protein
MGDLKQASASLSVEAVSVITTMIKRKLRSSTHHVDAALMDQLGIVQFQTL